MLRVRLGEPFMARQGAMVAYQGNVDFSFEGGGASKFLKKALTGEGLPLMRCQGQGDVFLTDAATTCTCSDSPTAACRSEVVVDAAEAPTFADTNAVVAWSANLQSQLKASFKAGALIGRGSGEARFG